MKRIFCVVIALLLMGGCGWQPVNQEPSETDFQTTGQPELETTEETTPAQSLSQQDPLEAYVEQMTIEERVGQLFLVSVPENQPLSEIEAYQFGGLLLFGADFEQETPESISRKIAEYQQSARIPLLIAVDEEGGTVCRVSSYPAFRESRFPSPRTLYQQGGCDLVLETEKEKCQLLRSLGVNVNLSPVCDISTDPEAFLYKRSLGLNGEDTAYVIVQMLSVMEQGHMGSVLKHFPGYGNNTDTHVASAVDERPLEAADLIPFRAGAAAGCDAIMVSHTVVTALDGELPASLSRKVHTYLREQMGYDGVIMTDDLAMAAVASGFGEGEAAVKAVLAGNDLLCTHSYKEQYAAVLQAVSTGEISIRQLNQSVVRVLRWKQRLGLLENVIEPNG